jgi:hypothetical protein
MQIIYDFVRCDAWNVIYFARIYLYLQLMNIAANEECKKMRDRDKKCVLPFQCITVLCCCFQFNIDA